MYPSFGQIALVATLAVSSALVIKRVDNQIWTAPDGTKANLNLNIADTTINWGSLPPWTAIDSMNQHCSDFGCDASWDITTGWVSDGEAAEGTITITVTDSSFPKGKLAAGVEVLKSAAANSYTVTQSDYTVNPCYTTACQGTPQEHATMDQYHAPKRISMRVDDDDDDLKALVSIDIKVTMESELQGACEDIVSAVGAVAGAVSGYLGAAFSLAAMFCDV